MLQFFAIFAAVRDSFLRRLRGRAFLGLVPPWCLAVLVILAGSFATHRSSAMEDARELARAQAHFAALAAEYARLADELRRP